MPISGSMHIETRRLSWPDPDRLLAPFRHEAGLPEKASPYGNWESMGLGGHTAGHYLSALAMIRQTLERVLGGMASFGMPGAPSTAYPEPTSDTYPSLLIAAREYVAGSGDAAWLAKNYDGLKAWTQKMLATDRDGNGLFEYEMSGNSGT